jgi:transmembrane sensor
MNPSNTSADIEAAAAAWFARREGDSWTAADERALEAWLNGATAHRIAYLRLVAAWERSGRLQALGAGIPAGVIPPRGAWRFQAGDATSEPSVGSSKPGWLGRRAAALAAGLVAVTVAVSLWLVSVNHLPEYSTQVGVVATVPLSDGSTVTLNTNSQIHVHLTTARRVIRLDRGEAFFEVKKDPARPFVVESGDKRVTAVGTQFTVRRDQDDIRVMVTEGRVKMSRETLLSHSAATAVAAGSAAQTRDDTVLVEPEKPGQAEDLLSWRSGYVVFHDTPLAEAIAEFNRYNPRRIVIADPTIATLRIGGRFRFADSDAFLWLLQNGFPIHVAEDGASVRLTRR